jgi:hypothetical protein
MYEKIVLNFFSPRLFISDTTSVEMSCDELSNSSRLRQLLGIVLQFGNRLNTAGVQSKRNAGAFSLDSLLKLNQTKAFDKKTTFLHYIVLIVQRNNQLLLNFQDDLPTVLKADKVYWDQCLGDLEEVENQLENVRRISLHQARMLQENRSKSPKSRKQQGGDDNDSLGDVELSLEEEVEALRATPIGMFTLNAIKQVSALRDKVELTSSKFHRLLEYFGEEEKKMQPHELLYIFSTFCRDFGKAKDEVFAKVQKKQREERKNARLSGINPRKGLPPAVTPRKGIPPAGPDRSNQKVLRASNLQPNMSSVIRGFQGSPAQSAQKHQKPSDGYVSPRSSVNKHDERKRMDHSNPPPPPPPKAPLATPPKSMRSPDTRKPPLRSTPNQHTRPEMPLPKNPVPLGMQEPRRLEQAVSTPRERQAPPPPPPPPPPSREQLDPASAAKSAMMRQKARLRAKTRQAQVGNGRTTPIASNTTPSSAPSPESATIPRAVNPSTIASVAINRDDSRSSGGAVSPRSMSPRSMVRHKRRLEERTRVSPSAQQQPNSATDWPVLSV